MLLRQRFSISSLSKDNQDRNAGVDRQTRLGDLKAEPCLQLNGPATQRLAGYTEVRVRGYGSVGRDQSQICIDLSNIEICVVEQVVDVRADFKSRVLSQTSHLRQTKAFAQAGVDISVARAVQAVAMDSRQRCGRGRGKGRALNVRRRCQEGRAIATVIRVDRLLERLVAGVCADTR